MESFSHSLGGCSFSGVFPWSIQGHHRPKSDVECVHGSHFGFVCLLYIYIASLSMPTVIQVVIFFLPG